MPRGANRVGAGAVKKTGQKKVSAEMQARYKRAAAAADEKLVVAELAFDADPSAENKAAVQQARAKACAASVKLGRAVSAEEGGSESGGGKSSSASAASASIEAEVEVKDWSQQKRARQARTDGSAVRSTGVTARNARARSAERAAERAARRQRSGATMPQGQVRRHRSGARSAGRADRGAEQRCLKGKWLLGITHTLIHSLQLIHLIWVQCRAHLI